MSGFDIDAAIAAADWHDLPRGFYAILVHAIDMDYTLDELDEDSYEVVGCRFYERKVQRVTKTGKHIGRDSWRGGWAWSETADQERVTRYMNRGSTPDARQFDIYLITDNEEYHQAMYGQWFGRCGCCGRKLSDPDSKMRGIGPECAKAAV